MLLDASMAPDWTFANVSRLAIFWRNVWTKLSNDEGSQTRIKSWTSCLMVLLSEPKAVVIVCSIVFALSKEIDKSSLWDLKFTSSLIAVTPSMIDFVPKPGRAFSTIHARTDDGLLVHERLT